MNQITKNPPNLFELIGQEYFKFKSQNLEQRP